MICIFGGTFDPVHFGHLRPALDVQQALGVERIDLLPCHIPPHRTLPQLDEQQRMTLLRLAIANEPCLGIDTRELRRAGPSYMVDTLVSLRDEFGDRPLCLILGMDALQGLDRWHRGDEILGLCHLVVMQRPGHGWPEDGALAEQLVQARVSEVQALHEASSGCVLAVPVTQMAVSSTQIRELLRTGRSARYLLPDTVLEHIRQESWYANR